MVCGFTNLSLVKSGLYFRSGISRKSSLCLGGEGVRRGTRECVMPQFLRSRDFMQLNKNIRRRGIEADKSCETKEGGIDLHKQVACGCRFTIVNSFNFYQIHNIQALLLFHPHQQSLSFSLILPAAPKLANLCRYATIFLNSSLQQFCYCMSSQNEDYTHDPLSKTDGSFQREKGSLNTTVIHSNYDSIAKLDSNKHDSQPTMPELPPFNSRALDFEETYTSYAMENQIAELMHRFSGIHKMLIDHAEYESALHEKKRGFKAIPIDRGSLTNDYSNKVNIISDMVTLVEELQTEAQTKNIQQLIDTKYLEYYLERHYGGATCETNNLSIQEKLEEEEKQRESRELVVSQLESVESLKNQSNSSSILAQQSCEMGREVVEVTVERIKIIEIEVPYVVFKGKQLVVRYEESDVHQQGNNIDSIIDRYSQPYENIYKNTKDPNINALHIVENAQEVQKTPVQSNIAIASIMVDSNHHSLRPKQTEIQLIYSDFPEQHNFKLPLDSFAQIESLISHDSASSTDRHSRPPTQRDNLIPINEEGIMITQKGVSISLLERIEQNQRILNEENLQLKEHIAILQEKLIGLQSRNKELQQHNDRLAKRLQEQIEQTEYFASKLDEINAEILEEKVECLTHLNLNKERKIEGLIKELNERNAKIDTISKEFLELEKTCQLNSEQITRKDEEIISLSKQLEQKEQELHELYNCEDNVIQYATNSQENLKKEIERLQLQKNALYDELKQYKNRLKVEGISLQYQEAAQIQGIIQSREHTYTLELLDIKKRYEEVMELYKVELKQLKDQLKDLNETVVRKTELLASKDAKELLNKMRNEKYFKELEEIIKEYDRQLEEKDEQILSLRLKKFADKDIEIVLNRFTSTISLLQGQITRERQQKMKMTKKFIELDEIVRAQLSKQSKTSDTDAEERLIEQLTIELEKKMSENKAIKLKMEEQSNLMAKMLENSGKMEATIHIKKENDKLKDINRKLKRYTAILEQQIRAVCSVDECESHRNWVNSLMDQNNYFCELLAKEASVPLEVRVGN